MRQLTFDDVLELMGDDWPRLKGIRTAKDLMLLGAGSLSRVAEIASQNLLQRHIDDEDRASLKQLARVKHRLDQLAQQSDERPILTRLRRQLFHRGDRVVVYLGDTPGALHQTWWNASVVDVCKGNRPEWRLDSSDRGFFWRVTVRGTEPWIDSRYELAFTTSEPRAQRLNDIEWFAAHPEEERFLSIFANNADRDWTPLWRIERSEQHLSAPTNMKTWLTEPIAAHR